MTALSLFPQAGWTNGPVVGAYLTISDPTLAQFDREADTEQFK